MVSSSSSSVVLVLLVSFVWCFVCLWERENETRGLGGGDAPGGRSSLSCWAHIRCHHFMTSAVVRGRWGICRCVCVVLDRAREPKCATEEAEEADAQVEPVAPSRRARRRCLDFSFSSCACRSFASFSALARSRACHRRYHCTRCAARRWLSRVLACFT